MTNLNTKNILYSKVVILTHCYSGLLEIAAHSSWELFATNNILITHTHILSLSHTRDSFLVSTLSLISEYPHQYVEIFFHFAHLKSTFSILLTYFYRIPTSVCLLYTCKDRIWLGSKTGTNPSSHSPNNEFIECRKES